MEGFKIQKSKVSSCLLMKIIYHLLKEGRPLKENITQLLDCLFNSIKLSTMFAKDTRTDRNDDDEDPYDRQMRYGNQNSSERMIWFPILINIRRLFLSLDSVFTRVETEA